MLFRYKISLDLEVEFEAPLLGVDTTKGKRKTAGSIAKSALSEMISLNSTSYANLDREIKEENLKGTVKGEISMRSANMIKEDNKTK
jgi:hypothetical protein